MFNTKTNQGWEIVSIIQHNDKTHIVAKRREGNYAWGSFYDVNSGSWANGHYDYTSPESALQDLIEFAFNKKLVNVEEEQEKGLKIDLEDFVNYQYDRDVENGDLKMDYEEFTDSMHQFYEEEIQAAYDKYDYLVS